MKKLYLSVLWHQHQPYYKDDGDGTYHMPWAYLHAIKDYYEMARHVAEAENVKVVFNYVPSLLIQLEDYASLNVPDAFVAALRKDVNTLSADEKRFVAGQCFMANVQNMVRPLRRFSELYDKLSDSGGDVSVFAGQELLDLEVMYIISWCGEFMRQEDPHVSYLLTKGAGFSEDEKHRLLESACLWIKKIKEIHKHLVSLGRAELSCTPFFHPILPLLTDISSAKEAFGDIAMPDVEGDFGQDADWHLTEGLKEFEHHFGVKACGMWPAEGSVSQKTAKKYAANGVRWIASDEEVLGNSMRLNMKDKANRHILYKRHFQIHDGKKLNIFFRDKELSDLIGFTYSSWNAHDAVNDFMGQLRRIYDSVDFSPHVCVILDGENAWEYYHRNAFDFFSELYKTLGSTEWLAMQTFSEAAENGEVPEEMMPNLVAGSWIMGNFRIWIGHEEKNRAWEMLSKTRRAMMRHIDEEPDDIKEKAYRELHAAEGSDWFWWFGDDHFSIQADVFDRLFRTHLINIRRLMKLDVPPELFRPIKRSARTGVLCKPVDFITPEIDGRITNFYEWQSGGIFDLKADAGSMHAGGGELKKLFYGFDEKNLYIALDSDFREADDKELEIEVVSASGEGAVVFKARLGAKTEASGMVAASGPIFEAAIPIRDEWRSWKGLCLSLRLKKGSIIIEKAPLYNVVEIDISRNFAEEWII